jgi:hypothetical protein
MTLPRSVSHYPLKGAALAVRQSRPGGALGGATACMHLFPLISNFSN